MSCGSPGTEMCITVMRLSIQGECTVHYSDEEVVSRATEIYLSLIKQGRCRGTTFLGRLAPTLS